MISVQSNALKGHAAKLKEKFTYALKEDNDDNMDQKYHKNQFINFARTNGQDNPKTSNHEDISLFEYSVIERRTLQIAELYQGQWYNRNY